MQPKEQEQLLGFRLTDDPHQADHPHHYGEEVGHLLAITHEEVNKARPRFLPKLQKLVQRYARVPDFRNLLSVYYNRRNKPEKSRQVLEELVRDFPGFLFGRVNLAITYLDHEQPDQMPEVLGEALDLKTLYPDRKVFHYEEYPAFELAVCRYLAAFDQ